MNEYYFGQIFMWSHPLGNHNKTQDWDFSAVHGNVYYKFIANESIKLFEQTSTVNVYSGSFFMSKVLWVAANS